MPVAVAAILFDFDFTLADPSRARGDCLNAALRAVGQAPRTHAELTETIGLSLAEVLARFMGTPHPDDQKQFLRGFVDEAERIMVDRTELYPGVPELIASLHEQGFHLGIVSMKYRAHIMPVLDRFNVAARFAVVIGGDDVREPKPHPEGLLLALRRLRMQPARALYVGESPGDAAASARAGVPFVAVTSPGDQEWLQNVPPSRRLAHVNALPRLLRTVAADEDARER